ECASWGVSQTLISVSPAGQKEELSEGSVVSASEMVIPLSEAPNSSVVSGISQRLFSKAACSAVRAGNSSAGVNVSSAFQKELFSKLLEVTGFSSGWELKSRVCSAIALFSGRNAAGSSASACVSSAGKRLGKGTMLSVYSDELACSV